MATQTTSGTISIATGTSVYGVSYGAEFTFSPATLVNAGSIGAAPQYGSAVWLLSGGYVSNASTGTISGGTGVYVAAIAGTVLNSGLITSTGTEGSFPQISGIALAGGGTVTNAAGGAVTGAEIGVLVYNDGAVVNAGSIGGGNRYGIMLGGGGYLSNVSGGTVTSGGDAVYVRGGWAPSATPVQLRHQ